MQYLKDNNLLMTGDSKVSRKASASNDIVSKITSFVDKMQSGLEKDSSKYSDEELLKKQKKNIELLEEVSNTLLS